MRSYFRILKALIYLVFLLPPTILLKKIRFPGYKAWPHKVHRALCKSFNVHVKVFGKQLEEQPVLFVSNHVSWIDIIVLGGVVKGCFIAKDDMKRWPILGYLSSLQRTIFINREKRTEVAQQKEIIQQRLKNGDNLILFPEGTTSDGGKVLPFKSSLFSVTEFDDDQKKMEIAKKPNEDEQQENDLALEANTSKAGQKQIEQELLAEAAEGGLLIQPVTLVYRKINNMPAIRTTRPLVAWFGDMEIGPHFKEFVKLNKVEVEIHFHQPVSRNVFKSRKELSAYCQRTVANKLIERLRSGDA